MIWQNIKMAFTSLRLAKLRSFLTMLGIIIGVTAVITVVSLGEGLKQAVTQEISTLGSNLIQITPGNAVIRNDEGEIESFNFAASFGASTLTQQDVELVREIEGVEGVTPIMLVSGTVRRDASSEPYQGAYITASNQDYTTVFPSQVIAQGEWFRDGDGNVAVIGSTIAEDLFPDENAIGQTFTIRSTEFTVIGVMAPHESALNFGAATDTFNKAINIPFQAGVALNQGISLIIEMDVAVDKPDNLDRVADEIRTKLTQVHEGEQDFSVVKQDEFSAITDNIVGLLTNAVVGLTSISLLVAGVGVMNIMLVSVTERTREIGIRKAIGASNRHILTQFLTESVVLTIFGGIIGVGVSYLLGFPIESQLGIQPVLTIEAFALAFLVTSGVGLIFGIAPALKAARKDPIEALRHE